MRIKLVHIDLMSLKYEFYIVMEMKLLFHEHGNGKPNNVEHSSKIHRYLYIFGTYIKSRPS